MSTMLSAPLPYPGRVVKKNFKNKQVVLAVQRRLNEMGCGPIDEDGDFGNQTLGAVMTFQARFPDADGVPLKVDGEVGALTWATLFGGQSVPVRNETSNELLAEVVRVAVSQIGVMEDPRGSNRGPQVDKYIEATGLNPSGRFAWCACFIFWCYKQACESLGKTNPVIKTAGVSEHWRRAGEKGIPRITGTQAVGNPGLIRPGHIFIMTFGSSGLGHTGLVERVTGGKLVTIEGNTNEGGSREGIGVFRRSLRKISNINKGFIDYGSN